MKSPIRQFKAGKWSEIEDALAEEEPLQISLDGVPIAVVMRTPGADIDLVYGFLLTEGIVIDTAQVETVDLDSKKNQAYVFSKDDVEIELSKLKRNLYSASSCGICGKASIESIHLQSEKIATRAELSPEVVLLAPQKMRDAQTLFESTGGIHAAALFDNKGEMLVLREDVGRHNAVDKVIGSYFTGREKVKAEQVFLQVSGRLSFEVMQKALMAGIPVVSAISAPSSLAVEFAKESNMSLYGFIRGDKFNRYN